MFGFTAHDRALLHAIARKLDLTLYLEISDMTILSDIQAAQEKTLADLTAETDLAAAIKKALDAQTAQIADLIQQVADAKGNGAGASDLQAILDRGNAILAAADSTKATLAVLAGTEAEPTPEPAPEVPPAPTDA